MSGDRLKSSQNDLDGKGRVLRHLLGILRNLRDKQLQKTGKEAPPPEPVRRAQRPRRPPRNASG